MTSLPGKSFLASVNQESGSNPYIIDIFFVMNNIYFIYICMIMYTSLEQNIYVKIFNILQ